MTAGVPKPRFVSSRRDSKIEKREERGLTTEKGRERKIGVMKREVPVEQDRERGR